jgi:hypothetical protein
MSDPENARVSISLTRSESHVAVSNMSERRKTHDGPETKPMTAALSSRRLYRRLSNTNESFCTAISLPTVSYEKSIGFCDVVVALIVRADRHSLSNRYNSPLLPARPVLERTPDGTDVRKGAHNRRRDHDFAGMRPNTIEIALRHLEIGLGSQREWRPPLKKLCHQRRVPFRKAHEKVCAN